MQVYVNDILFGVAVFPFLALVITLPYMIFQYRRYGSIPWWRTLIVYLFVFYLLCTYFLVILPLPESRTTFVPYAAHPQLVPFFAVWELVTATQFAWDNPGTWLSPFLSYGFAGIVFNIFLMVPLGMFLRYYFKCSWWECLIIGFCTSLFFEVTQLTGLYGIYEHPYRLFDVDDLITNTLGAMIGYWMMGPVLKWLPSMNALNQEAREKGAYASLTRRVLAFVIDLVLVIGSSFLIILVFSLFGAVVPTAQLSVGDVSLFSVGDVVLGAFFFVLIPVLTRGQTLGQKLLKLGIVRPNASPASWYQYIFRYGLLFLILAAPIWLIDWLLRVDLSTASELSAIATFFQKIQEVLPIIGILAFCAWGISILVRNHLAKKNGQIFAMLNEHISGTRIMTIQGIEALRDQRVVLDVRDVAALEKRIAEEGISLEELMRRAGHSVAEVIRTRNPEPTTVLVFCGAGNNGGDGWVVAHDLANDGYSVTVVSARLPGQLEGEPAKSVAMETFADSQKENLPLRVVVSPRDEILSQELAKAEIIVDAILGTGFSGKSVREPYDQWIRAMNKRHKKRKKSFLISIDVPSGFSAQTGQHAVPCILADLTVTMIVYKPGLIGKKAARFCGPIRLARLVDAEAYPDLFS